MSAVSAPPRQATPAARTAVRLAWSLCALSLLLMLVSLVLLVLGRHARFPPSPVSWTPSWSEGVVSILGLLGAPILGALLAAHRPHNRYGWVWCALGLAFALSALANAYTIYALFVTHGRLPGSLATAWANSSLSYLVLGLLPFVFLLFPDGRLPSPRWRVVGWAAGSACVGLAAIHAVAPGPLDGFPLLNNPLGIGGAGMAKVVATLDELFYGVFIAVSFVAGPVAVLARFRRARGQARQQLKWFAVVGLLVLAALFSTLFYSEEDHPVASAAALDLVLWGLYAAIGIAVLRHGLYDIDRLLNRALVYGLLTILLGGLYAAIVLTLGQLAGRIGTDPPSWAVAGATLAVAALFQPARHRIQQLVDRRFNRRRYDAAKTIEAFSTRLRDEIDLDTLAAELLAVIDQTTQPSQASLWLRPPEAPTKHQRTVGTASTDPRVHQDSA